MKTHEIILTLGLLAIITTFPVNGKDNGFTVGDAKEALVFAGKQYKLLKETIPFNQFPRTIDENGKLIPSGSSWWCSGFYPGTHWFLFEHLKDQAFKTEAINKSFWLEKEKFNRWTHDLGFMIFCSYGNGYRLTGESNYKDIIITASNTLCTRFNPAVGCIKSWDHGEWEFPVIIDNMMNLEMLFWATKVTGDQKYRNIAIQHAETTLENHFREDGSSYHLVDFEPRTGEILGKVTVQGYADESAWARGQAWGLYGYTMTYRETGNKDFLEQAMKIADFVLEHPNMPEDLIPYWDYNAPDIPNTKRDASAGAIIASALLELSRYSGEKGKFYHEQATRMLASLSSKAYRADLGENGNFILKHSVGHFTKNSEVDVPLTYADYYYVEALIRFIHEGG
jgi:rhamnogalacturonyl hydrolase YesR